MPKKNPDGTVVKPGGSLIERTFDEFSKKLDPAKDALRLAKHDVQKKLASKASEYGITAPGLPVCLPLLTFNDIRTLLKTTPSSPRTEAATMLDHLINPTRKTLTRAQGILQPLKAPNITNSNLGWAKDHRRLLHSHTDLPQDLTLIGSRHSRSHNSSSMIQTDIQVSEAFPVTSKH